MAGSPPEDAAATGPLGMLVAAFRIVGAAALTVLVLATVLGVAWRYVLADPIFGIEDIASLALGTFVATALAVTAWEGAHLSVDLIDKVLSPRWSRALFVLTSGLGVLTTLLAAWSLVDKGSCGRPCGDFTSNLSISHTPFYYLFAAAFGFYALVLSVRALTVLRGRG